MDIEIKLEKIKFIEQNLSFFMQRPLEKLNHHDNVSTALLTILLSEKKLEDCRNYPLLLGLIKIHEEIIFYDSFIELISNLQNYVKKILNYSIEAEIIKRELDQFAQLYKEYSFAKVKKMA